MLLKNLFKYWTYQVFSPGTVLKEKYHAFKSLLKNDKHAHERMAELEEIYHNQIRVDFRVIEDKYDLLSRCVSNMIDDLSRICYSRYLNLRDYFNKFDFYIRFMLAPPEYDLSPPFTLPLEEIPSDAHGMVGGKALNLAVIQQDLQLPVPKGFAITTNAFYYTIEFNNLRKSIDERLSGLDIYSSESLTAVSHTLMEMIMNARIPPEIKEAIFDAFWTLQRSEGKGTRIAMRSSAVAEDSLSSFAGLYRTVLNVTEDGIMQAYKRVLASKYDSKAIYYRVNYGLSDAETPMAVIALKMIDAENSGVMYTHDLENPESNAAVIHAIWGLGELLVGGEIAPDVVKVSKEKDSKIIEKKASVKSQQIVFSKNNGTVIVPLSTGKSRSASLDDASAKVLAQWGQKLEIFFGGPQDIEWCMDKHGNLSILQSRPLIIEDTDTQALECKFENIENAVLLSGGERASAGVGTGNVFQIKREEDFENLPQGTVLVARNPSTRYVKVMDRLSAVVTDTGSIAGHFSSVAREFGVPVLVNTGVATTDLPHGREVTVFADGKLVYDGIVQSLLEKSCVRKNLLTNSPFTRKLKYIMSFISPLKLIDSQAKTFSPEGCRSLHDIIRFIHEKAVQEMFSISSKRVPRKKGARKLSTKIPMMCYVLDVGGGIEEDLSSVKEIRVEDITSAPMKAIWRGLSHPDIHWSEFSHFDWAEYDKIVMSGGIISADSAQFASYAVLAADYLNLNLKFGYHFVILDTICGDEPEDNYILFRFSGGGADFNKRSLRAHFLEQVLTHLGFEVDLKGDLVDAQLRTAEMKTVEAKLDLIGRLMGATRLMDMYLKDESMVNNFVEDFMNGRYHFASVE